MASDQHTATRAAQQAGPIPDSEVPWAELEATIPTDRAHASVVALVECTLVELTNAAVGAVLISRQIGRSTRTQYVACDAVGVDTADVDDATAQRLINDLVDADIVTPVLKDHVLVHEPSGTTFDSTTQLAVFHRGWTAGRDADVEAE